MTGTGGKTEGVSRPPPSGPRTSLKHLSRLRGCSRNENKYLACRKAPGGRVDQSGYGVRAEVGWGDGSVGTVLTVPA